MGKVTGQAWISWVSPRYVSPAEEKWLLTNRVLLLFLDKYGFFTVENEADKKIIWEKLNLEFTTSLADDESKLARLENLSHEDNVGMLSKTTSDLKTIVSKIQDCVPNFPSEIDDLHFIGSGIRQKNGIKNITGTHKDNGKNKNFTRNTIS